LFILITQGLNFLAITSLVCLTILICELFILNMNFIINSWLFFYRIIKKLIILLFNFTFTFIKYYFFCIITDYFSGYSLFIIFIFKFIEYFI